MSENIPGSNEIVGILGEPETNRQGALDYLAQALSLLLSIDDPRILTSLRLVDRLRAFAKKHYDFFQNGFTPGNPIQLKRSKIFSRAAVLDKILNQLSEDSEVVMRAALQRRIPAMRAKLDIADALAYRALQVVATAYPETFNSAEGFTAMTYFQKSHEIRVIPYAPVALIGIPLTCLQEDRDFLAIPHELGHYLYRHFKAIRQETPPPDFLKWEEELFADVSASLLAGAVMTFDFQEWMLRADRELFLEKDEAHPAAFLRPLIYSAALRADGNQIEKALADAMDRRWSKKLTSIWCASLSIEPVSDLVSLSARIRSLVTALPTGTLDEDGKYLKHLSVALAWIKMDGEQVSLRDDLDAYITRIAQRLKFKDDWSGSLFEMQNPPPEDRDDLDAEFKGHIDNLIRNVQVRNLGAGNPERTWIEWVEREGFFDSQTLSAIENPTVTAPLLLGVGNDTYEMVKKDAGNASDNPRWQPLWDSSGWMTGPMGHPPDG